jgi:hypothetical protein
VVVEGAKAWVEGWSSLSCSWLRERAARSALERSDAGLAVGPAMALMSRGALLLGWLGWHHPSAPEAGAVRRPDLSGAETVHQWFR